MMKKKGLFQTLMSVLLVVCLGMTACSENVDMDSRYVFNKKTVMEYLLAHEDYSEYCNLLKISTLSNMTSTTLDKLLLARGHYTVFAPTNQAIQDYLDTLAANDIIDKASWDVLITY